LVRRRTTQFSQLNDRKRIAAWEGSYSFPTRNALEIRTSAKVVPHVFYHA
jgi:hypothetical protein